MKISLSQFLELYYKFKGERMTDLDDIVKFDYFKIEKDRIVSLYELRLKLLIDHLVENGCTDTHLETKNFRTIINTLTNSRSDDLYMIIVEKLNGSQQFVLDKNTDNIISDSIFFSYNK